MQKEERKWGVATSVYTALVTYGDTAYKANPTLASGDATRSLDGAAFSNLSTLPDVNPASGRAVRIQLSASEMEASTVMVQLVDQTSPKEWEDQMIVIETPKARGLVVGKAVTGTLTASTFTTNLTSSTNDAYNRCWVCFTSGALVGQTSQISDYDGSTKLVTVADALTGAPSNGDTFEIISGI